MSKLEDKTVEIMDKAMVGAEKLTEKMAELAVQYGPDVINAGLAVARVTAAEKLLYGVFWLAVFGFLVWVGLAGFRWMKREDEFGFSPLLIIPAVFGSFSFIGVASYLGNIWNWVGLFEPKLWIAHRILEKAL